MKILIADEMHPSIVEMFATQGWECMYVPKADRAEIIRLINGFDGLVIRSKTAIDAELIANASRLRFVARAGAGLDQIDLPAVTERKIALFHASEGNADAVAEHAVGMLLALLNKIVTADSEVRAGVWLREKNRGVELMNKTVGLIGYGHNGRATAERLVGFKCKILAYDKYKKGFGSDSVEEVTLDRIMADADIVSWHIPLTSETRGMLNNRFLERMEKSFYLVNVARGEISELATIVKGLREGKILGACLDVLENERLGSLSASQQKAFDFLRETDRVILTPHIAGWSKESYVRINEVLSLQIQKWLKENNLNPRR